jgi:hypothetical protein
MFVPLLDLADDDGIVAGANQDGAAAILVGPGCNPCPQGADLATLRPE